MKIAKSNIVSMALLAIVFTLSGCARGTEFDVPTQPGARYSKDFPNFNIKPEAATQQYSIAEGQRLTRELQAQAKATKRDVDAQQTQTTSDNSNFSVEDAHREAENALREIEQSATPATN